MTHKVHKANNIAMSLINNNINILYESTNTAFDFIFKELPYAVYDITNLLPATHYDITFSHNFLTHDNTNYQIALMYNINSILTFNTVSPKELKKEDIFLILDNNKMSKKIFFGNNIAESWIGTKTLPENSSVIDYGLPKYDINNEDRDQIVLLNFSKNKNIEQLYKILKQSFQNIKMLDDISQINSATHFSEILSEYTICIDLVSMFNALFAANAGCHVITSNFNLNCSMITELSSLDSVTPTINNLLAQNVKNSLINSESIEQLRLKYDYDTFVKNINNLLYENTKKEIFIP